MDTEPARDTTAPVFERKAWLAYGSAINAVKETFGGGENISPARWESLAQAARSIAALSQEDNQELLALANRATAGNYVYAHSVNTAILACRAAAALGWPDERLVRLGLSALIHDIGLRPWLVVAHQPRRLNPVELAEIKLRAWEGARLVAESAPEELGRGILEGIIRRQGHRRAYDRQFPFDEVAVSAEILDLCDTYEAMCHPRHWRKALTPHAAIKAVARSPYWDKEALGLFLSRLSPYPPGSFLRLTTGEIARVVRVNERSVLRPQVAALADAEGQWLEFPRLIDLAGASQVYIDDAVDETKLAGANARLRAAFAANRWWLS